MPSNIRTPTDQTASASSIDGAPSPDTDDALLGVSIGGVTNIVLSVTAIYDGDSDGTGGTQRSRVYYSFDGVSYTLVREVSGVLYTEGHTDVVSVGNGSLTNFRVQAYAASTAGAGAPVPFANTDILSWFVTYDTPGMVVEG